MGAQQQLCKIYQAPLMADLFISLIDSLMRDLKKVVARRHLMSTPTLIFLTVDKPGRLPRRPFFFIDVLGFHDAFDQTHLIVTVDNLKVLWQFGFSPMHAQQPVRQSMEGTHPHRACGDVQQGFRSCTKFSRSFIGERYGQNAVWGHTLHVDKPGNTVH